MNECKDCNMPVGISCCFNCGRDGSKCGVWHDCGKNCPGWEKMTKGDLISRNALIERYSEPCHSFLDVIETIPAVDAEPVRHGKWIKGGYVCGDNEWKCSVCGETEWRGSADWMKFCMYCGAKMDLEDEQ